MSWYTAISAIFGEWAPVVVAAATFLFALGLYKFIKDWLPW